LEEAEFCSSRSLISLSPNEKKATSDEEINPEQMIKMVKITAGINNSPDGSVTTL
jgi:hypothetical protein